MKEVSELLDPLFGPIKHHVHMQRAIMTLAQEFVRRVFEHGDRGELSLAACCLLHPVPAAAQIVPDRFAEHVIVTRRGLTPPLSNWRIEVDRYGECKSSIQGIRKAFRVQD